MKLKTKQITVTAVMIALSIVVIQFIGAEYEPLSVDVNLSNT